MLPISGSLPKIAALAVAAVALGQPLYAQHGFLDVSQETGVFKNGSQVSTGLQAAILKARDQRKVAYFPAGTYRINSPMVLEQTSDTSSGDCAGHVLNPRSIVMVGQTTTGTRPVIKLEDNDSDFQSTTNPKAMVRIFFDDGTGEGSNCAFANIFRNIDLDLGVGNEGAIGLKFGAAQESAIANVKVQARDGYAGLHAFPGRGGGARNVEVIGGRYGIWVDDPEGGALGGYLANIKLTGQSDAALYEGAARGMAIMGLHIEKNSGPAIITDRDSYSEGSYGIYDGRVELTNGGAVFNNAADVTIVLRNFYVKGASTLADNPGTGDDQSLTSSNWTRIDKYVYLPQNTGNPLTRAVNVLNGAVNTNNIYEFQGNAGTPPSNLLSNHNFSGPPDYNASGVVNVTTVSNPVVPNDGLDDRARLQQLIDSNTAIFLPQGIYELSGPLNMKANTVLFGVPGRRTSLKPNFNTLGQYVITTDDSATGTAILADVAFDTPSKINIGTIHWRVGKNSNIANIRDMLGQHRRDESVARTIYRVSGSGGGRWWSWVEDHNVETSGTNTNFRKLVVEGTTQPFTLYGFNFEHGGQMDGANHPTMVEVISAQNVRFFGGKHEIHGPVLTFKNSTNVLLGVSIANPEPFTDPLLVMDGSTQAEADILIWDNNTTSLVDEKNPNGTQEVKKNELLGNFRRGTALNWSAWNLSSGGNQAPTVATPVSANPNPVTNASTTNLSVLGADDGGESGLTYTWSTVTKPSGAANPTFSANTSNAAKNTVATFSASGSYTLRVTISDGSLSVTDDEAISVTLPSAPVVTPFTSSVAAEVREANPTTNYGTATTVVVGGNSGGFKKEGLIKFTTSGLSGTVTNAILRLTLDSTNTDSGDTITVYKNSTTTWTESGTGGVTWNTKPAYGTSVTTFTVGSTSGTIDINVTSAITGNGTFSFHLATAGIDNTKFSSDDAASGQPQLIVTTQ